MKLKTSLRLGLETIAFQSDPALFNDLRIVINKLRTEKSITADKLKKSGLDKIIHSRTGITIFPVLETGAKGIGYVAYVKPPQIDANNPVVNYYRKNWLNQNVDGLAAIRSAKGMVTGSLNRATGKVTGVFSEIGCELTIFKSFFTTDHFTDEEVAAIILHEVGHIWSYFEMLGEMITTNYVLQTVSKEFLKTGDNEKRVAILSEAEIVLGIKIENKQDLARVSNDDTLQTVIISNVVRENRSEFNSYVYDLTGWEQLSDQFAARHGCGVHLATALDKLYRLYGTDSYMTGFGFYFWEAIKLMLVIGSMYTGYGIVLVLLTLMYCPLEREYDEPAARLQRIRKQMVEQTKLRDMTPEMRTDLLNDIAAVDAILKTITDRETFYYKVWKNLVPWGRRQVKAMEFQKIMEDLANNELYVNSAKILNIQQQSES